MINIKLMISYQSLQIRFAKQISNIKSYKYVKIIFLLHY